MKRLNTIPKMDGFSMPGEFDTHLGTYLLWPERTDNWRNGAKPAQKVFAQLAKIIAKYELCTMCVSSVQYVNAKNLCGDTVRIVEMSNNDSWIRDCGATFIKNKNGEIRGIDWSFNAWGGLVEGLYFPWDKDDIVALKMCELEYKDSYNIEDFILEGGSIHVDGEGTLITTEECLLNIDRNSEMTKEEIEKKLCNSLGVEKVLWIPRGIYLDETNGHVDNICSFVKPGVVVLAWTDDVSDPQYEISKEAYDYLSSVTDAKGRKLQIHKLNIPKKHVIITQEESEGVDAINGTLPRQVGDRMAASYVNYYHVNNAIIMPTFDDENDELAKNKLQELYPDRKIETIYAREIILGGGNIHCITQQVPKGNQ